MKLENVLLTQEEGEAAVNTWRDEDYLRREFSLGRGHWEDIVLVIARAQVEKFIRLGGVIKAKDQGFPPFHSDYHDKKIYVTICQALAATGCRRIEEILE